VRAVQTYMISTTVSPKKGTIGTYEKRILLVLVTRTCLSFT